MNPRSDLTILIPFAQISISLLELLESLRLQNPSGLSSNILLCHIGHQQLKHAEFFPEQHILHLSGVHDIDLLQTHLREQGGDFLLFLPPFSWIQPQFLQHIATAITQTPTHTPPPFAFMPMRHPPGFAGSLKTADNLLHLSHPAPSFLTEPTPVLCTRAAALEGDPFFSLSHSQFPGTHAFLNYKTLPKSTPYLASPLIMSKRRASFREFLLSDTAFGFRLAEQQFGSVRSGSDKSTTQKAMRSIPIAPTLALLLLPLCLLEGRLLPVVWALLVMHWLQYLRFARHLREFGAPFGYVVFPTYLSCRNTARSCGYLLGCGWFLGRSVLRSLKRRIKG